MMGIYLLTDYNPYDGYNHLNIHFDGFNEKLTKDEFIELSIKAIKENWHLVEYFQKKNVLKKRDKKKQPSRYDAQCLKWEIFKRDNFTCQKCASQDLLEVDHIIPISKGGSNKEDNLQTLCLPCNRKKKDKIE